MDLMFSSGSHLRNVGTSLNGHSGRVPSHIQGSGTFTTMPSEMWTMSSSHPFVFRSKEYSSASSALEEYINEYEGKRPMSNDSRVSSDVDALLLPSASFHLYGGRQDSGDGINLQAERSRMSDINRIVQNAYESLENSESIAAARSKPQNTAFRRSTRIQRILNKACHNLSDTLISAAENCHPSNHLGKALDESEKLLTSVTIDNVSSLPGSSVISKTSDDLQSLTTDALLDPNLLITGLPRTSIRVNHQSLDRQASRDITLDECFTPKTKATLSRLRGMRQSAEIRAQSTNNLYASEKLKSDLGRLSLKDRHRLNQVPERNSQYDHSKTLNLMSSIGNSRPMIKPMSHYEGTVEDFTPSSLNMKDLSPSSSVIAGAPGDYTLLKSGLKTVETPDHNHASKNRTDLTAIASPIIRKSLPPKKSVSELTDNTDDLLLFSPKGKPLSGLQRPQVTSTPGKTLSIKSKKQTKLPETGSMPNDATNARRRNYLRQLLKEIDESPGSVISQTFEMESESPCESDTHIDGALDIQHPNAPSTGQDNKQNKSVHFKNANYLPDSERFSYLNQIQSLLSQPVMNPALNSDNNNSEASTDVILEGDRSWEKALPSFKSPVLFESSLQALTKSDRLVDQFKMECLKTEEKDAIPGSLIKGEQPGTLEALKNMLFTVQSMVPQGGSTDSQIEEQDDGQLNLTSEAGGTPKQAEGDFAHLLSTSFEHQPNSESLNRALQHLDVLQNLVGKQGAGDS